MASTSGEGGEEYPRPPVRYCAVYTCLHNYKTHPNLAYFSIPNKEKRCLTWLKKIHRMDILKNGRVSGYHRVCEEHFRPRDICSNDKKRWLRAGAVPALRLPLGDRFITVNEPARPERAAHVPAPAPAEQPASGERPAPAERPDPAAAPPPGAKVLTTSKLEVFEYVDKTPKLTASRRQRPESRPFRRQPPAPAAAPPAALADFFAACDNHLNQNMAEFVKVIAQLKQKEGSGQSDGLHSLCVKLLVGAPEAYRLLQPALALPPPAALRRRAAPLLLHCNQQLADLLKMRVDRMSENEKYCTVSLDYIDVKPHLYYNITFDRIIGLHEIDGAQEPWPARHCAVLTVRALLAAWAQPAALCFPARADAALPAWVDGVVRRLLALGLRVRALVADPAAPAARRPAVSPARPFFHVDKHKIYVMYDPPMLMKLLLCDFIQYDFHFEKTIAKWDDIVQYRNLEKHKPLTLTPQLTDAHTGAGALRLARGSRPRRAVRLLSRQLAAALASYNERKLLGASAPATIKFILKINDLYDILDSTAKSTERYHTRGLTEDTGQIEFLSYMKSFFKALKLKDCADCEVPDSGKLSECWQVSIATVLALRAELAPLPRGLATRRLHLDRRVAEAARGAARKGDGRPTCWGIFAAFKKHFFDDILQPPGEDTPVDLNGFLSQVNSVSGSSIIRADVFDIEDEAQVQASDYRGSRRRGGLAGVAARLLAAARRVHGGCAAAAAYLSGAPSASLLRLLRRLDAALAAALRAAQPARARLADLLLDLHVLDCDLPCECFPLQYLKKLFLRLRLYDILRNNRAEFKKSGDVVKFHVDTLE